MSSKVLMFQGTGSDVGKSTLVAGLCRIATRRGLSVAPFKPQNMSNNAAACPEGGEVGRAQALQARACGLDPHVDFNPVLLKPQSDRTAQVVVHGKVLNITSASDYMTQQRAHLKQAVLESFSRLNKQYDLVLVEGAGSPAEINLRAHDIANMGFARAVNAPVCLVGDIDRGGVIAAIAGTQHVIDPADAALIKHFVINRFRGDPALFEDGIVMLESITGWPCLGVVPWLSSALKLPQEDAVVLDDWSGQQQRADQTIHIAVPMLSRIANFDDLDPLRTETNVTLVFVPPGTPIPLDTDVVIIPGTKSTIGDMAFLEAQGWHHDIKAIVRAGGRVLGLCGGYQLLGKAIHDPDGVDGAARSIAGLGLLNVETTMQGEKRTSPVSGVCHVSQHPVSGYEIHAGVTTGADCERPLFLLGDKQDGASSLNAQVQGTYLHGVFSSDTFRSHWLESIKRGAASELQFDTMVENALDELANGLEAALDIDALLDSAQSPATS